MLILNSIVTLIMLVVILALLSRNYYLSNKDIKSKYNTHKGNCTLYNRESEYNIKIPRYSKIISHSFDKSGELTLILLIDDKYYLFYCNKMIGYRLIGDTSITFISCLI